MDGEEASSQSRKLSRVSSCVFRCDLTLRRRKLTTLRIACGPFSKVTQALIVNLSSRRRTSRCEWRSWDVAGWGAKEQWRQLLSGSSHFCYSTKTAAARNRSQMNAPVLALKKGPI